MIKNFEMPDRRRRRRRPKVVPTAAADFVRQQKPVFYAGRGIKQLHRQRREGGWSV